ncbi:MULTISPECIES: distal tail protein Dit [Vallitalea]|uniref:Uncharacterized protein n=1 Tax=Vallitalea maricola TaxID=3074433 RepID=A0ACB5UEX1_9FIRM|nr:distal tail protein Dit [Vallitalea guaymasensis]GMQ61207.1 hypothetical protein AN2V17_04350 [Vallitalea sp. AN17-2]
MYGLIFNNIHSDTYNLIMRSVDRQLLPVRDKTSIKVSGKAGTANFDNNYNNRFITIELGFEFSSLQELQLRKREIAKWLSGYGKLQFDDEPDKYYTGRIYNAISFEQDYQLASFQVVFECDTFAYGSQVNINNVFNDNSHTIDITYNGTAETEQVIKVKNIGSNSINGFKIKIEK